MSGQFICSNFLEELSKLPGINRNHTQYMKNIFNAVCCKNCGLSNAFLQNSNGYGGPQGSHKKKSLR